jgi:hypothetical protein
VTTPVVLASGHLVDRPDRPSPRFPPSRVPWVTDLVGGVLDEWRVGPGAIVICGGARGADIIAAEEGHSRGAHVVLCLALPPEKFERRSVDLPGTEWRERFRRLLKVAEVRQLPEGAGDASADDEAFDRANKWMIDMAHRLARRPYAVIVWDGRPGDGRGGTFDLIRQLGYPADDPRIRVIDPTPPG